eukprot:CAMPEP_0116841810 /NCGR_PEP_ID=MMETSP0418-20121206/11162_1 /TAXON_ID=1158023 /ORGANISM="Astrosyne radiata, Strain 13vi08-1A" /LENGTH=143 /DNA_ID=CAMNT_0004472339 /DNA_START=288 /DNA_END=719 /DNA_ORIENTATION=-
MRSGPPFAWQGHFPHDAGLRVSDKDDSIEISLDVPGIKKQDLKVTIDDEKILEISGVRFVTSPEGEKGKEESFSQTFSLAKEKFDESKMKANLSNGVLVVTIPKEAKPATAVLEISITESPVEKESDEPVEESKAPAGGSKEA